MSENFLIGSSFSPEYCEYIGVRKPIESLKFLYSDLGIKDVRFGLRWNLIDSGKEINLDYYREYLDYFFKKDKSLLKCWPN